MINTFLIALAFTNIAFGHELADMGFKDYDKFISSDLGVINGQNVIRFGLASKFTSKRTPLNTCAYLEDALKAQVRGIQDPQVRGDFKGFFLYGAYSSVTIEEFYREFSALLKRTDPTCPVPELPELLRRFDAQSG